MDGVAASIVSLAVGDPCAFADGRLPDLLSLSERALAGRDGLPAPGLSPLARAPWHGPEGGCLAIVAEIACW